MSKAVNNDWPIEQIDVPTSFLNGILKEDFIKQPEDVKLKRSLYGLWGSPKYWNDTFYETV